MTIMVLLSAYQSSLSSSSSPQSSSQSSSVSTDPLAVYTPEEVRDRDGTNGNPLWVTYRGEVFDVSAFREVHPGGKMIEQSAGETDDCFVTCLYLKAFSHKSTQISMQKFYPTSP